MLLVLDIGNTNITLGIYDNENIVKAFRLNSDISNTVEYYKKNISENTKGYAITDCIIGSVVEELNEKLKMICDEIFELDTFVFKSNNKTGVTIEPEKIKTIGVDRIANAYASYLMYSQPSIVIDMGSSTTFDVVSQEGKFLGGIIMPGIDMQFTVLNEKTSKLPKLKAREIETVIGKNTETCMLSGVIRGQACAIDGLICECEKELNQNVIIISTGGLNSLVAKYMTKKIDYINPELTLFGLKKLYELNKKS